MIIFFLLCHLIIFITADAGVSTSPTTAATTPTTKPIAAIQTTTAAKATNNTPRSYDLKAPEYPKHFFFSFPEEYSCNYKSDDGLFIMEGPSELKHWYSSYTHIDYKQVDQCWHLNGRSGLLLRSCESSSTSHPPETGWEVCMTAECTETVEHTGKFLLSPLSADFTQEFTHPPTTLTISGPGSEECAWDSQHSPALCGDGLEQMAGTYNLVGSHYAFPSYKHTSDTSKRIYVNTYDYNGCNKWEWKFRHYYDSQDHYTVISASHPLAASPLSWPEWENANGHITIGEWMWDRGYLGMEDQIICFGQESQQLDSFNLTIIHNGVQDCLGWDEEEFTISVGSSQHCQWTLTLLLIFFASLFY